MDMLSVMHLIGALVGAALAAFIGTARNRAKMGEVQMERQAPIVNSVESLAQRMDAKDRVIFEISERLAAIEKSSAAAERVSRRTEIAVKGGEMEPHTSPFLKSHEQLLVDEVKRRNLK